MRVSAAGLPGVLIIEPDVHRDARGLFYESYNARRFAAEAGIAATFVQDNHAHSAKNVLRGLHYQLAHPQGRLVRVTRGEVFDVVVDLRRGSPGFGRWAATRLSAENRRTLWVPRGCAHGFLVLSDSAETLYKTDSYWDPADERVLAWDDPELAIAWPLAGPPLLSDKDRGGRRLRDAECYA
jgi:dTDP-4-dehydrorhamnose 3,5-epimerase